MGYENEHEARCDLAAAHRMAVLDGLNEGTWNHFSLMSPVHPEQMRRSVQAGVLGPAMSATSGIDTDNACMPCGQGAGSIRDVASCREIVESVVRDARETIERLGALV